MIKQRAAATKQYVVFHLKLIEVLHLTLLSVYLSDTRSAPDNSLGHGIDRFKETLLGTTVTAFMAIVDKPDSTHARNILRDLYPKHAKAINRIWERRISAGERVMKAYRDKAGAHGDKPTRYFAGKMGLFQNKDIVLTALDAFFGLSTCLMNRQIKELPDFASDIESVLLDVELGLGSKNSLNRRWLCEMRLIRSGPFKKTFH